MCHSVGRSERTAAQRSVFQDYAIQSPASNEGDGTLRQFIYWLPRPITFVKAGDIRELKQCVGIGEKVSNKFFEIHKTKQ